MNRDIFFDHVRKSVFGGRLSKPQVKGLTALLDSIARNKVSDPHHVANILAQVWKETGGYMLGVKETVYASSRVKNPSDATVIRRLDRAWAKGQLKYVKRPYWRSGYFGRGPIQITLKGNYVKFSRLLGIDLVGNPSLALDPAIGADIAVIGMRDGRFRSHGLGDYVFPRDLDNDPETNPRRIANGEDGSDRDVASKHRKFYAAIVAAGGAPVAEIGEPEGAAPAKTARGWLAALVDFIVSLFRRKP